jgi:hypothetical protein
MAKQGFYRTWKTDLHANLRLQGLMQPGIGESYPIFAFTDNGLHIRHFYHDADQVGPDTMYIGSPRALVTLDYESRDIVSADVDPFDLPAFEPVQYTLSAQERIARRPAVDHLVMLYDRMMESYPEPPSSELRDEFATTLHQVVPPVLWPFYQLLLHDLIRES